MPDQPKPILKLGRILRGQKYQAAVAEARAQTGKGAFRQAFEILRFAFGPGHFSPAEYYLEGLWRTDRTEAEKSGYISERKSTALNKKLSPVDGSGLHGLLADKLLTGLVLRAAGFPNLAPRAVFGDIVQIPGVRRLQNAQDIASFLGNEDNLPVFGKPLHSSLSIGAGSFVSLAGNGNALALGDGRIVGLRALALEIAANFARGYVFEPLIRQHPDVEKVTGPAVGSLRIVTLRTERDVEVLYTLQRQPAVGAMVDAFSNANPYTTALIDRETGRVLRACATGSLMAEGLEASLVTEVRFDTVTLPFMNEAHAIALGVHRLLVRPGLLGFDMALTSEGPLVTEINSNPFHTSYQHAARRGLLNPDFKPRIEAALAVVRGERKRG